MISKNLKTILFGTLLASFAIKAVDDTTMIPPLDDALPPIKNAAGASNTDENFDRLVGTLKSLTANNKSLNRWKDAIAEFQASLPGDLEDSGLDNIHQRLLESDLVQPRKAMVTKAINKLKNPPSNTSGVLVPTGPSSALLAQVKPHYPPIGMIIFSAATAKKPTLSSAKKASGQKLALSAQTDERKAISALPVGQRAHSSIAISTHLKRFIAGQDSAIDSLSFLAHRFMCNKFLVDQGQPVANSPMHCILTGPTGCGKSESLKQLGLFLGVPILHINARSLTDEGFKGQNFSECIEKFCKEFKFPPSAIVELDEIDKLASNREERETDGKSFGRAIQRILLAPLDGSPVSLKDRQVQLKNWWFVGAGAFSGLQGLHDNKVERSTTARTHQDIIIAGFEPEFAGRFSSIIPFKGHTLETMMDVISREGSPIKNVKNEFNRFYGADLVFQEDAIRQLALTSIEMNLGVRSLNSILNMALQPLYARAQELMGASKSEDNTPLLVTLEDICPAIEQFKKDNKKRDPRDDLSEAARSMYS
ncbi:MAG: AAA family ATPase [Proteobacteria bacterium]|nr:AAA family ATPase [Pseudomonadota bacterium]